MSHFADFEHVTIKIVILLTLNKSKNILPTLNKPKKNLTAKLPWEKPDTYAFVFLFRSLPHVTGTPPWLLRPMRVSTSSELYPDTWLFFFECIGIQFFNSLTCDLRTPCHARGHLHSHSHSYLGKQCISLGVTIILSMCFCSHT